MADAPALVPESDPETGAVDPDAQARVEEFFLVLNKAVRAHQLYGGRNPAVDRLVQTLREKMTAIWETLPNLAVQVEEHEIVWEGQTVYHSLERLDNLAFLFYRDGVRELTFLPGFEDVDLPGFLKLLVRLHRVRNDEDDLLTLLWEMDLPNLRYTYIDTLAEGIDPLLMSGEPASPLNPESVRAEAESSQVRPGITEEDFDEALYFLDEAELRQLGDEIRREDQRDLWADVLAGLFDRLEDGEIERQNAIIEIIAELFPTLVGAGNFAKGALILREFSGVATVQPPLPIPIRREIRSLFLQLGTPESVEELIRTTEEVPGAASDESLPEFLGFFPPEALGPLILAEARCARPEVRRTIGEAIERLGVAHGERVVDLLGTSDPELLAGASRWAGRLKVGSAASSLVQLLEHPDVKVRGAAVAALQDLRSSTAAQALPRCLGDPEREVRIAAARALGSLRIPAAVEPLERAIMSRAIREADVTEQIAFFEAFGSVAGESGIPVLERMLHGKAWLGRRESSEIRACAALGLGKIQHAASTQALRAAAADSDPIVRSAVGRALKGEAP